MQSLHFILDHCDFIYCKDKNKIYYSLQNESFNNDQVFFALTVENYVYCLVDLVSLQFIKDNFNFLIKEKEIEEYIIIVNIKILEILESIVSAFISFFSDENNCKKKFESLLISPNQNIILVFSEKAVENNNNINNIKKICSLIINLCVQNIKQVYQSFKINSEKLPDFTEILSHISNINENIPSNCLSYFIEILKNQMNRFGKSFLMVEMYWIDLIYIIKCYCEQKKVIYNIFHLKLRYHEKNSDELQFTESYKEMVNILNHNFPVSFLKFISDLFHYKINQINPKNRYKYIDCFYQILKKEFFSKNIIHSQLHKIINQNIMHFVGNNSRFSKNCSSNKLFFDNEMNFYAQYVSESLKRNQIESGINFLKNKKSKFIVNIEEINQNIQNNEILYPYFAIGPLDNAIQDASIRFSLIDKFVIITEIAICLDELNLKDIFIDLNCGVVMIDHKKNAYIGLLTCHDKSNNNYDNNETLSVIKSFGIMIHEIITDTTFDSRLKRKSQDKINGDLCSFLFSGEKNCRFKDDYLIEFKEIIEKCLSNNKKVCYSSMKEIIEAIKDLKFYVKNKNEIEFRISTAIDGQDYHCNISDIFEYYLRSDKLSLDEIKNIFSKIEFLDPDKLRYITNFFVAFLNESKTLFSIFRSENIDLQFSYQSCSINNLWLNLFNYSKYGKFIDDEITDVFSILEILYFVYNKKAQFKQACEDFMYSYCKSNHILQPKLTKKNFINIIIEMQKKRQYFYFFDFLIGLIRFVFYQDFVLKYNEDVENGKYENDFLSLGNIENFVYRNESEKETLPLSFYDKKDYRKSNNELLEKQKNIMNSSCSKFISNLHINKDRTFIPHFTKGSLKSNLENLEKQIIRLTYVDKAVIIIEIVKAIVDIHSDNKFHGNISDENISIDWRNNAYFKEIYHDRSNEFNSTIFDNHAYFHSPRLIKLIYDQHNLDQNQGTFNEHVKDDLYSLSILIYEILTNEMPQNKFNGTREQKIEALKSNTFESLLNGLNDECFQENATDSQGNTVADFKKIIKKCHEGGYETANDLLEAIKQTNIYNKNKTEIEYRLSKAEDGRKYRCTYFSLIVSFLQGDIASKDFILKALQKERRPKINKEGGSEIDVGDDILTSINNEIEIKLKSDLFLSSPLNLFEDFITTLLHYYAKKRLKEEYSDHNNILQQISIKANFDQIKIENELNQKYYGKKVFQKQIINFIIPISSFRTFVENNKDKLKDISLTWIYVLAKDLSKIHAETYHGELSEYSIGIYYDKETEMYVPLIIPYYCVYMRDEKYKTKNKKSDGKHKTIDKKSDEYKSKMMEKDIREFFNIINEILIFLPIDEKNKFIEELKRNDSIDLIYHFIYNYIRENHDDLLKQNEEQIKIFDRYFEKDEQDVHSYQLTCSELRKIAETDKYKLDGSIISQFQQLWKSAKV